MNSKLFLFALFIFSSFAIAQDPVKIAPEAYKLVFENEFVKVQRVHYAPHAKIPEHDHTAFPAAYIYLNDAGPVIFKHVGLSYGAVTRPAVKAGSFRLYKAVKETHTVENPGNTHSDFLRVEFKTETGKEPNSLRGKFFRLIAPAGENFQQIQFENEQVRITRLVCAAGKNCLEVANAKEPILFVVLTPATFNIAKANGIKLNPGDTHWIEAGKSVQGVNISKTAAELLRFDFKTAPMEKGRAGEQFHSHGTPPKTPINSERVKEAIYFLKRGVEFDEAGKIQEAITAHELAVITNPELLQAHLNLISMYGRISQFEKAEKHYKSVAMINPEIPELHYNLGVLRVAQDRPVEAAAAFLDAIKFNPNYAEAHFNYATIIEADGKLDEAAKHHRLALAEKSDYRAAHFSLGRILVHQENFKEALEHFEKTLLPDDAETPRNMYALGATYIRAGDKIKGIEFLREALKRASALKQTQLVESLENALKSLEH
jgi:tetratricopeptide (TPR) repeat protein